MNTWKKWQKKTDLKGIRYKCRGINERAISIQQPIDPNWIRQESDHNPFDRVKIGGKWIPGIKINDEKMVSVMKGLLKSSVMGIKMRDLTDFVNHDQGRSIEDRYSLSKISYSVRKLRGHGLIEKIRGKNLYRPTKSGIFLSKCSSGL